MCFSFLIFNLHIHPMAECLLVSFCPVSLSHERGKKWRIQFRPDAGSKAHTVFVAADSISLQSWIQTLFSGRVFCGSGGPLYYNTFLREGLSWLRGKHFKVPRIGGMHLLTMENPKSQTFLERNILLLQGECLPFRTTSWIQHCFCRPVHLLLQGFQLSMEE